MMLIDDMHMAGTWILHIKSQLSNVIRHDALPILKYMCIIDSNFMIISSKWNHLVSLINQSKYVRSYFPPM